ncbi:hypothetical protein [Paradevosia shaoguanensis]|uniref:hypothetical protein n=1 Tax=Paradevosia shaoguanensis TaxID=1335043 RepID=UPI001933E9C4|nr:hypothetical protein [Paradevosia shaoguanensis]
MAAEITVRVGTDRSGKTRDLMLFVALPDGREVVCDLCECSWAAEYIKGRTGIDATEAIVAAIERDAVPSIYQHVDADALNFAAFHRARLDAEAGLVALDGAIAAIPSLFPVEA